MKCKPVVFRAAAFERSRKQHTVHLPPLGFHYRSRNGTPPLQALQVDTAELQVNSADLQVLTGIWKFNSGMLTVHPREAKFVPKYLNQKWQKSTFQRKNMRGIPTHFFFEKIVHHRFLNNYNSLIKIATNHKSRIQKKSWPSGFNTANATLKTDQAKNSKRKKKSCEKNSEKKQNIYKSKNGDLNQ